VRSAHLLVLHGPHLDWLGEAPLPNAPSLDSSNREIALALAGSAEVRSAQGNSEAELVNALHRSRDWATHVLLSPGALAATAHVLRQALALLKLPFAEVFLDALPGSAEHAKQSVLRNGGSVQQRGAAPAVYLEAARRLLEVKPAPAVATSAPKVEKQIGRTVAPRNQARTPGHSAKTIGRIAANTPLRSNSGINRATVRQQISDRLSGRISPAQLATWGREQWLAVEGGAATEAGHREMLGEALQALALSTAGSGLSEPELLEWMARMG
jgi:3-dehydroquinate dehydratase II